MSIIGPRPALWNQDDLYEERAKYGANGCVPGLTGWAQINGRDELEIDVKSKLDGEYVQKIIKCDMPDEEILLTIRLSLRRILIQNIPLEQKKFNYGFQSH